MQIGILSDTHDRLPPFRKALALFERLHVGAVIHAGDIVAPFAAKAMAPDALSLPLHVIYGNNDGERAGLRQILPGIVDGPLTVKLGGKTIVVHHALEWLKPQDIAGANVVITGHTHKIVNEVKDGRLILNPGECCGWVTGRCTAALLDLDTLKADIIDIQAV